MREWALLLGLVAVGGGLGGVARFWVSGMVARRWGETFPWGTLVVNVTGSGAVGVLAALLLEPTSHASSGLPLWAGLVVGLLGSFTTVSAFSLQTLALLRDGEPGRAALNVMASLVLCLAAATLGYALTLVVVTLPA